MKIFITIYFCLVLFFVYSIIKTTLELPAQEPKYIALPIGDTQNTSIKLECRKMNTNKHIFRMSCIFLPNDYK